MSAMSCPFCRIVSGELAAAIVHRDETIIAFRDIHPVAPIHILIVPARHIASLRDMPADDSGLIARMISVAREVAGIEGVDSGGYRLVVNTGEAAGQSVFHLHMHLLAGRRMHWPPG